MNTEPDPTPVEITGLTLEALRDSGQLDYSDECPTQIWEVRQDRATGTHSARMLAAGHNGTATFREASNAPNRAPSPAIAVGMTTTGTVWITEARLDAIVEAARTRSDEMPQPFGDSDSPDAYPHRAVKVVTYGTHNRCAEGYLIERADGTHSPVIVSEMTPTLDDPAHPHLSALLAHRRTSSTIERAVRNELRAIAAEAGFDTDDERSVAALMAMLAADAVPDDLRARLEDITRAAMLAADCPPIEDPTED